MRLGGAGCGVRHQGPFAIAEPRRSDAVSLRSARAALDAAQKTRGKVGVSGEESEWRRQWRQPRRKREQNSRFCGHNGLAKASALISLRDMGVEEVRSQRPTILRTVV